MVAVRQPSPRPSRNVCAFDHRMGGVAMAAHVPDDEYTHLETPAAPSGLGWAALQSRASKTALRQLLKSCGMGLWGSVVQGADNLVERGSATRLFLDIADHDRSDRLPRAARERLYRIAYRALTSMTVDLAFRDHCCGSSEDYRRLAGRARSHQPAAEAISDREFAYARVAGANPDRLERVRDLGLDHDLVELWAGRQANVDTGGLSRDTSSLWQLRCESARLFKLDFRDAPPVVATHETHHPFPRRHLCRPAAFFDLDPSSGELRPLAIVYRKYPGGPLMAYSPASRHDLWVRAKLAVQAADANDLSLVGHLGHTHFVLEAIALVTRNHLRDNGHPVGRFLAPYLAGTLAVNEIAQLTLPFESNPFAEIWGEDVAASMARVYAASHELASRFGDDTPPEQFATRGVDDPRMIYPFRDDLLQHWTIARDWAHQFVSIHYADDASVARDRSLAVWAREAASPDAGRILGFARAQSPANITSRAGLAQLLATIVCMASARHAAHHFGQTEMASNCLHMPYYSRLPLPGHDDRHDTQSWVESLPPLRTAAVSHFLMQSADFRWGSLLAPHFDSTDPRERAAYAQARTDWERLQTRIEARNLTLIARGLPAFTRLEPALVPPSANI